MDLAVKVIRWRDGKRNGRWMCTYECSQCGKEVYAFEENVRAGKSTRCVMCRGRNAGDKNITHNLSREKLYGKWNDIKRRCYNKNRKDYARYGGKGVTMCDEWLDSFQAFYDWSIKNGYKEGLHLDKDLLCDKLGVYPKVYSPITCMWMTATDNAKYRNGSHNASNS